MEQFDYGAGIIAAAKRYEEAADSLWARYVRERKSTSRSDSAFVDYEAADATAYARMVAETEEITRHASQAENTEEREKALEERAKGFAEPGAQKSQVGYGTAEARRQEDVAEKEKAELERRKKRPLFYAFGYVRLEIAQAIALAHEQGFGKKTRKALAKLKDACDKATKKIDEDKAS